MSFFKAYDMRGTFGVDFDLDTVYRVGLALPQTVAKGRWLVGRDTRLTSEAVRDALVNGLLEAGAEVTDLGLCTTPMVYYFTAADDFDGSVMITASHNPSGDNGLKVSKKTALPVGYASGLAEVEAIVRRVGVQRASCSVHRASCVVSEMPDALERYLEWQLRHAARSTQHVNLAVDCSNGMASLFAHEMFPGAVFLNDRMNGNFPAHSPNPLDPKAREQIARVVRDEGLDCGVIFDGDADRAMFVDERGEFVQSDYLTVLVARATARGKNFAEPPTIIHDVRTSRGTIETLREMGMKPVMVPVGHAFAKPILRKIGALCGGELAGHYYFGEFFGCDSGLLAATRILSEIAAAKEKGVTFSELMKPIVSRYANSGEINFKIPEVEGLPADKDAKDLAIERVLKFAAAELPREISRSTMDGYRLEYEDGWLSIRKSNTEPYLRLLVEAKTPQLMHEWVERISAVVV